MRVLLLALLTACTPAERHALSHDGLDRNYYLYVPDGLDGPAPLVVGLHGGGPFGRSKGRGFGGFSGLIELADREGFVAVFPSSLEGNWNDGRELAAGYNAGQDDVGFLDAVIEDVAGQVAIDRDRVYATGASNGGFMAQRLACERTDTYAAVASVIATMPTTLDCQPSRPIPVMFVPGTDDPLVLWEGGEVAGGDRGESRSVADAVAFWTLRNECTGEPVVTELPDADPDDGTRVREERYTQCAAEVNLLAVEGGGHTWPGGSQYLPQKVIGPVTHDIDGAEAVWGFLSRFER